MKVVVNINTVNSINTKGISNKEVLREAINRSLRDLLPSGSTFTIGLCNRYDDGDIVFNILHTKTYLFHVYQVSPLVNGGAPYVLTYDETSSNVGDIVSTLAKSLTTYFKQRLIDSGFNVKNNQSDTLSSEDKHIERLKTLEEKYRQILVNYALVIRTIDLNETRYKLNEKFRLMYQLIMSGVGKHNELLVENEFNLLEKLLSDFNKQCYEYTSNPPQQHIYPADSGTLLREVRALMDKFFKVFTKYANGSYDDMLSMGLCSDILSKIETLLNTLISTNYTDTRSTYESIKQIHDNIDKLEKRYLYNTINRNAQATINTKGYGSNMHNEQQREVYQPWGFNQPAGYQLTQQMFTPLEYRFGYFNPPSPTPYTPPVYGNSYEQDCADTCNKQHDKRIPVHFNVLTTDTQYIDIINNDVMVNCEFKHIVISPIEDNNTYTINMVYAIESNNLSLQFTYDDKLMYEYIESMLNSSLSTIVTNGIKFAEKTIVEAVTKTRKEDCVHDDDTLNIVLVMTLADKNKYEININVLNDDTGTIRLISNSKKQTVDVSHGYDFNNSLAILKHVYELQTNIETLKSFLES